MISKRELFPPARVLFEFGHTNKHKTKGKTLAHLALVWGCWEE